MKKIIFIPLVLSLFTSSVIASEVNKEVAKCFSKEGSLDRLNCYDNLAKEIGVAGSKTETKKISGSGEWRVSSEINPIDDSRTDTLFLVSDEGGNTIRDNPYLVLRCKSNTTELYINWDDYLGGDVHVLTRIGKEEAETRQWSLSTDKTASFYANGTIGFIKDMMNADSLIAQTTPYGESPVTAIFNTKGLENAIKPLRENCNW